jgi:hypothetical protein
MTRPKHARRRTQDIETIRPEFAGRAHATTRADLVKPQV